MRSLFAGKLKIPETLLENVLSSECWTVTDENKVEVVRDMKDWNAVLLPQSSRFALSFPYFFWCSAKREWQSAFLPIMCHAQGLKDRVLGSIFMPIGLKLSVVEGYISTDAQINKQTDSSSFIILASLTRLFAALQASNAALFGCLAPSDFFCYHIWPWPVTLTFVQSHINYIIISHLYCCTISIALKKRISRQLKRCVDQKSYGLQPFSILAHVCKLHE